MNCPFYTWKLSIAKTSNHFFPSLLNWSCLNVYCIGWLLLDQLGPEILWVVCQTAVPVRNWTIGARWCHGTFSRPAHVHHVCPADVTLRTCRENVPWHHLALIVQFITGTTTWQTTQRILIPIDHFSNVYCLLYRLTSSGSIGIRNPLSGLSNCCPS